MKQLTALLCTLLLAAVTSAQQLQLHADLDPVTTTPFTEGPAVAPDGSIFFSDVRNSRILQLTDGRLTRFRHPSGHANGLAFDPQGRLIACEGGGAESARRVTRTERNGSITVLADSYDGHRLNSPNDLAILRDGTILFSDPRYGDRSSIEQRDADGQPVEAVYEISTDGSIRRLLADEITRPNGLAFSPDEQTLYVADNAGPGGPAKLWAFSRNADGDLNSQRLLYDFGQDRGPDGMAVHPSGRIYVAAGANDWPHSDSNRHPAAVYIFDPDGTPRGRIDVPVDSATNCTLDPHDPNHLYITAGTKLFSTTISD